MKLVDQLYQMYEYHFTGDEEDAWIIVRGIFDEYDRQDFIEHIKELNDREVEEMFMFYVYHKLREKIDHEGIGYIHNNDDQLFH